jgi:hypothetical protein
MKKFLFLLLLSPLALQAQRPVGMGEYQSFLINPTDHAVYTMRTGVQVKVPGQPANIVNVFGGLHVHYFLDASGNVYAYDENVVTWKLVDTKVVKVAPAVGGTGFAAIHIDGSLWVQGVQQKLPAGTVITDVWYPNAVFALDSAGNVYSGNYSGDKSANILMQGTNSPITTGMAKVPLPSPAAMIAAHSWGAHFVLRNGQQYAGGQDTRYYGYGMGQLSAVPIAPIRVDQLYKLPAPIIQISASFMTTYAILSDRSMWAWGENTQGTVGNGQETNMLATTPNYSAPWYGLGPWTLPSSQGGALFQLLPTQIGKGIQWADLKRGTCYAMYEFAEDIKGTIYSWGRWKGLVLWNGVTGTSDQQANQPNLHDVLVPTPIKDFANVTPPPPANIPPTAVVFNIDSTVLSASGPDTVAIDGTHSFDKDGSISSYSWSVITGPSGAAIGGGATATGIFPSAGTYTVQLIVKDNAGALDTALAYVKVLPRTYPPPVVCPPIPPQRSVLSVTITILGQDITVPASLIKFINYSN